MKTDSLGKPRVRAVDVMTRDLWQRLLRKGYDPAYAVKLEKSDIPSITETFRYPPGADRARFRPVRSMAVVLSKGPLDRSRRVVAESRDGWVRGLYIALLRRQVREGLEPVKGKCYAVLVTLEFDDGWGFLTDRWLDELLTKRPF